MVAREAVSDAMRHAQPQAVRVSVHFAAASMRLHMVDDGSGFDSRKTFIAGAGHFGLIGLRERVGGVGGRFEAEASPGAGTRFLIEVPVRPLSTVKRSMSLKA